MRGLDRETTSAAVKLIIFMVVTTIATTLLAVTIGNVSFSGSREYKAVFSDVTGVVKGDDVRIAGVAVGSVKDTEVVNQTQGLVTFTVVNDVVVTGATEATIRYRNLVGQRYIALTQGVGKDDERLEDGATIPLSRTTPALDLTVLFNGFKPLFAALSPSDINTLSFEIIKVFQGEGGTVESLLRNTAGITQELANRDQIIGDLISNLNRILETVGDRDDELGQLLESLRAFISGLNSDREAILGSLDSVSKLSEQTAQLLTGIRPSFVRDVRELRTVAGTLRRNRGEIDRALTVLPIKLRKVGRTAIYGSWFNFYLCNFTGSVKLPGGGSVPIDYTVEAERCDLR